MADKSTEFRMQEIHTPSAFEGVLWGLVGVKDAITIFHAPPGCYINQHVNMLVNDLTMELYTSNLSYANVMQGAEDKLEEAVRKLIKKEPKALFILTAPSVEVTQDDVEGVAAKVGYKNTVIVRPPIGGSLNDGKEAVFMALLDIMDKDCAKRKRSVNIIGPTYSSFNWMSGVFELERMLNGIGVEVNTVMTADAKVAEIQRAPAAELNLCIYPYDCGVPTAKEMEKRFDIPYLADPVPVGFENSAKWLEQVADFFKLEDRSFIKNEMQRAIEFVSSNLVFTVCFEMTACLSLDNSNTMAVGISEFFTQEAGVEIVMCTVSSEEAGERIKGVCDEVLVNPTMEQKRDKMLATSPLAIFGNFYDKKMSMDEGFQNFIFADMPSIGYLNSENCPFMGFRGSKYLLQTMINEVYMGIFLETKGDMEGSISGGVVPWELNAEKALIKVSEMIPHFVRATAVKKLHQVAEQMAVDAGTNVTIDMVREVADKFTPTKFKAKFGAIFEEPGMAEAEAEEEPGMSMNMDDYDFSDEPEVPIDTLDFTMPWKDDAKQMLELVPSPFRQAAAKNTEIYTKEHDADTVTVEHFDAFRKELGM
jgi:light-independent protochlorophyllide reductase B subunit